VHSVSSFKLFLFTKEKNEDNVFPFYSQNSDNSIEIMNFSEPTDQYNKIETDQTYQNETNTISNYDISKPMDIPYIDKPSFEVSTYWSNKLIIFKEECIIQNLDYIEVFKSLSVGSEMNIARQQLRDWWNNFIEKFQIESYWQLENIEGWLVRALNHLNLLEPFDEAVYEKCQFCKTSGNYWKGKNRPWRYDWIEDKYTQQLERKDYQFPDNYLKKRKVLELLFGENIPYLRYDVLIK